MRLVVHRLRFDLGILAHLFKSSVLLVQLSQFIVIHNFQEFALNLCEHELILRHHVKSLRLQRGLLMIFLESLLSVLASHELTRQLAVILMLRVVVLLHFHDDF